MFGHKRCVRVEGHNLVESQHFVVIVSTKFLAQSISTYMTKVETRNIEEDYEEWKNHILDDS